VGHSQTGDTHAVVTEFLASSEGGATSGTDDVRPAAAAAVELTKDQLLAALDEANWNRTKAAAALGVSRQAFWRSIVKHPDLRIVADLELADILLALESCDGDLKRLAVKLGASEALLARRLARRTK